MKSELGKRLLEGAGNASRLLGEMKMLHAKKKHLVDETVLCAMLDCMAGEKQYRSAFDIFEEKRNIEELLETIGGYNAKLAACVESLKRL